MSDLSGSATTLRSDGYKTRLYLSIPSEVEVWRGEVTATVSEPTLTLTVSNVSGTAGDVAQDMEAEVFDSGGTSKGRVRVAYGGLSGGTLNIEEVSKGRILIEVGDEIAAYKSWRLRPKLVAASATFDKDSREMYSNQNSIIKPLAVSGGAWAGFADWDGGSTVDIAFSGSASAAVDPDSGGTLAYAWDFGSGSVQSGSAAAATATVRYSAVKEWGSLTVTDSSNSATQIQHYPICVHPRTGADAPIELLACSLYGTSEYGWEAQFTLAEGASLTDIPDGSLVIIWAEEYYGNTRVSYGANETGRSHIKFIGYIVSDEADAVERNDSIYTVARFRALSPLAMLAQLPGFSQVLERVTSPASWIEYKDLTSKQAFIYLLRWGTTFLETHDLIFNFSFTDPAFPAYYLQQNVPERQLREVADGLDCALSCDRYGRLRVHRHLVLESTGIRNTRTTTFTLTDSDYFGKLRMQREHRYTYSQLDVSGFSAGASIETVAAFLSVAPGVAPADAPQMTQAERKIAASQPDLNTRAGYLFAKDNWTYNGLVLPRDIELRVLPSLDVFDFREEWIKLDFATDSNARGVTFSNRRCWLDRVSIEYDFERGAKRVTLTVQPETIGAAGTTQEVEPPETANDIWPDISLDFPWLVLPQPIDPLPDWIIDNQTGDPQYIFAVGVNANTSDNEVYRGVIDWDASPPTVTWTTIGTGITGTYCWSRGDPYNPYRKFIATSTGMWKIENIFTPTSPTQVATLADMFGGGATTWPAFFEMSNNRKGFMVVMAGTSVLTGSGGGIPTSGAYTTDYCATWTTFDIAGGSPTFSATGGMYSHSIGVSPHNNPNATNQGWFYSAYYSAASTVRVMRSTDWCASWSQLMTITVANTTGNNHVRVFTPYTRAGGTANKNNSSQRTHFVSWTGNQGEWGTFDVAGNLYNNVSPSVTGNPMGQSDLLPMNTLTSNGSYYYLVSHRSTSGVGVLRSTDAGAAFVDGAMDPSTSALKIGSEANGSPFSSSLNGWGTEGTLVQFSPGHSTNNLMHTAYTQTTAAGTGTVKTAYTTLGDSNAVGFLRIKRGADSDWTYILTPAYRQKICYAEYQLPA